MKQEPTKPNEVPRILAPWTYDKGTKMPHGKAILVSHIISEYQKSTKYMELSIKSKMRYQAVFRLFDLLILANNKSLFRMPVHAVDYAIVDYIHKVLSHTHEPATIKSYFSTLASVWQQALRVGKAVYNPWLRNQVVVDNERDVLWTSQEIDRAIAKAKELGYDLLAFYILMAYETGQRPWSDLRMLKWDNVKRNGDDFYFDFIISKTNVRIQIPLSKRARDMLLTLPRQHDYIFVTKAGKHLTSSGIVAQLNKVKDAAMLPEDLQFRDIRRSVVTEMVQAGATDEEIRATTGWTSSAVLHRYSRLKLRTAQNALSKRDAFREETHDSVHESLGVHEKLKSEE